MISSQTLPDLFVYLSEVFLQNRELLIELDGKVGDSDLGITMVGAFGAARDVALKNRGEPLTTQFKKAGASMAAAAPSTMGTLVATGFLRGAKAVGDYENLDLKAWASFWRAFTDGIAERGKAQLGDKTVLDVLEPISASLEASVESGSTLNESLKEASKSAEVALEATKTMEAQRGKAAAFGKKTVGLQDAGGTVALILIRGISEFSQNLQDG
jgi:dihydroxyacetone kinase-like protein